MKRPQMTVEELRRKNNVPNHVTNLIEAPAEVLDYLRSTRPADDQTFGSDDECDFDRVIPMPHWSHPAFTAERSEHRDADGNLIALGYGSGYALLDWATTWWGTKWNAYNVKRETETRLRFETAWSHPAPVLKVLSHLFPEVTITVKYADEDIGHNLGAYTITNGKVTPLGSLDPGTAEAHDFAAQLIYGRSWAELKAEWDEERES